MWIKFRGCSLRILFLLVLVPLAPRASAQLAQPARPRMTAVTVPHDSSSVLWGLGAGIGVPYGVIGGKLGLGSSHFSGEIGGGFVPLAWRSVFSAGAAFYLGSRGATLRPKLTFSYSSAVAAIVILNGTDSLDPLYDELFPGYGVYGGLDWRLGESSPLCLDLNVGMIHASGGNQKVEDRFDEITAGLIEQGYVLTDKSMSLNTPKISVGVTYAPGRSKRVLYVPVASAEPDPLVDSDHDGVPDIRDKEPNTPLGAEVDLEGRARDDDGDGVPNGIDQEDNTSPGEMVDQLGRSIDADHDGVENSKDECPDTGADEAVNAVGCTIEVWDLEEKIIDVGRFEESRIYFDTGQATIKAESYPSLDVIGEALSGLPVLRFEVRGHCDDRGSDEFNQRLSELRAAAVLDYLVGKFPELRREQFTATGYGKRVPVEVGPTEASRAKNRRVEFLVLNKEEAKQQIQTKRKLRRGEALPDSLPPSPPPR